MKYVLTFEYSNNTFVVADTETGEIVKTYYSAAEMLIDSITWNHTGKMKGMNSLSTSCLENPNCIKRLENGSGNHICSYCFSEAQQKRQKTTREKMRRNTAILTERLFVVAEMPFLNSSIFRLEAFGDLVNPTQARNYIRLAKRNPGTTFALWTKNPWILEEAIKAEGKPGNMIVILSAELLDVQQPEILFRRMKNRFSFIDKMFLVYRPETVKAENIDINCGARSCMQCRKCYTPGTAEIIKEELK